MKNKLLLCLFLLVGSSFAEDASQAVPGQISDSPYETPGKNSVPIEPSIYERQNPDSDEAKPVYGKANSSPYENGTLKKNQQDFGQTMSGDNSNYLTFKNKNLVKENYQASKTMMGFSYYKDDYDYDDGAGSFEATFERDAAKSVKAGYLMGSYRHNFYRSTFDFYVQTDTGLSYSTGRGVFPSDGKVSRTRFNIWVVPLDVMLGTKINLGKYMGVSMMAGPSLAVITQNRSDREEGDKSKDLVQVGYGYTAQASLDFSLSQIFPDYGVSLRNNSDISDLSFSIIARSVELSGFKESYLKINGLSIGAGFKFEIL